MAQWIRLELEFSVLPAQAIVAVPLERLVPVKLHTGRALVQTLPGKSGNAVLWFARAKMAV